MDCDPELPDSGGAAEFNGTRRFAVSGARVSGEAGFPAMPKTKERSDSLGIFAARGRKHPAPPCRIPDSGMKVRAVASRSACDDPPSLREVVPDHEAIEILAAREDHAARRGLRESVGEANVLLVLAPAGDEEDVEHATLPAEEGGLPHRRLLGSWIGGVEKEEVVVLEVRGRKPVGDQYHLSVRRVCVRAQSSSEAEGVLDVREVGGGGPVR